MVSPLLVNELVWVGLLWLCLILLYGLWPGDRTATGQISPRPAKPTPKRAQAPQPFPGLLHKPHCEACAPDAAVSPHRASAPPPRLIFSRGRRRTIALSQHFCPDPDCAYYGWVDRGNLRSNGHPGGKPWRQLQCVACRGYFPETQGTPLQSKQVSAERVVWAMGAVAEGLGIRAVARVFAVDPNTILQWLGEVAEHAVTFSRHFLHDVRVPQVQLDELYASLRAGKVGEVSEAETIKRLARPPHWIWAAIDPVSKLLLTIEAGERTLAMAQRVVHQVVQSLAPDCAPLFLTDGFKAYLTALLTHYGHWVQPTRRWAQGPMPKPRWLAQPHLLYAQVVKRYRRRRLVGMRPRVVFGSLNTVKQVLGSQGWQINTAFIERVNLSIRQHVAAVGRRVLTLCQEEDGLRQQLALYHVYYNFCLPHGSLRLPLPRPMLTHGTGSAKRWRPCTPAMAAGLTDRVWSLREVLLFRVPPWPQPKS
jgi:IS1 family transposase/transposase-like protein